MRSQPLYLITLTLALNGCGEIREQSSQQNHLQETNQSVQDLEIIETADGLINNKLEWAVFLDGKSERYIQFQLIDGEIHANFPVYFYKSKKYKREDTNAKALECSKEEPVLNMENFNKVNYMNASEIKNLQNIILSRGIDQINSYCRNYDVYGELIGYSADIDFRFPYPAHEWPSELKNIFNEVRGVSPERILIETDAQSL